MTIKFLQTLRAFSLLALSLFTVRLASAQVAPWVEAYPFATSHTAVAYDSSHQVVVLFGGDRPAFPSAALFSQTWTWNGSTWTQRLGQRPSARASHAMAYDITRGVAVLFGGYTGAINGNSEPLNGETWEWNGTTWQQIVVSGPSPRSGHAMVYHAALQKVVLFGGLTSSGSSSEMWTWDGSTWTLVSNTGPSPRSAHAMSYDSDRNVIVLFGGNTGVVNGETWEWDGTGWSQIQAGGAVPAARAEHAMAFDPVRHRTVLCGGKIGSNYSNQTYEWDGSQWTLQTPSSSGSLAYDVARNRMVLFYGSTAERTDSLWTTVAVGSTGTQIGIAFDSVRNVTRLVDNNGLTWNWRGGAWSRDSAPSAGPVGPLAFDSVRAKTVLVGSGQTWEHDGTAWARQSIAGPSSRTEHRLVFDSHRGVTVLFGGFPNLNDTWEWDGLEWTQRAVAGPPGRSNHAMAYDSIRRVTVLFGGRASGGMFLGDTWEWDGSSWAQRFVSGPPARTGHAMSFDSARGVCVLFGGTPGANETWEWNGIAWTQRQVYSYQASCSSNHGLAFDSARAVTVMHGSTSGAPTREYGSLCTPPSVVNHPSPVVSCPGALASFSVAGSGNGQFTYRWRKNGVAMDPFANSTVTASTLELPNVQSSNQGLYDCLVRDDCGIATSNTASLTICAADFNCDATVDFFDYLDFVQAFADNSASADFNNDTIVDFFDYLDFVQSFSTGC